jgi:hypothetical protein
MFIIEFANSKEFSAPVIVSVEGDVVQVDQNVEAVSFRLVFEDTESLFGAGIVIDVQGDKGQGISLTGRKLRQRSAKSPSSKCPLGLSLARSREWSIMG